MIIYLDECGDLGLSLDRRKTSRYLIIGLLVFPEGVSGAAHIGMVRAVKRTLKNKLSKDTVELKGSKLVLSIKKYFVKEILKKSNWRLYIAVANKKLWLEHHCKHNSELDKKALYDEVAKRIFFHVDGIEKSFNIDLIVDRSKNKDEITVFDQAIIKALTDRLAKNTRLSIRHRNSQEDVGLQAIDIFCSGVGEKYEQGNLTWYKEFSGRIAVEVEYKF